VPGGAPPPRRQECAVELVKLGEHAAPAVAPLANALAEDGAVACEAASVLGMLGAVAVPALPELRRHAAGADPQLAARCKAAVLAIDRALAARADARPAGR
jgi:hypothetical protein